MKPISLDLLSSLNWLSMEESLPRGAYLLVWEELEREEPRLDPLPSMYTWPPCPQKQQKANSNNKRPRQDKILWIRSGYLTGRLPMPYDGYPFPRSEPHNFECLAGEEVENENDHANSASSQDRPSQGEELIEISQA